MGKWHEDLAEANLPWGERLKRHWLAVCVSIAAHCAIVGALLSIAISVGRTEPERNVEVARLELVEIPRQPELPQDEPPQEASTSRLSLPDATPQAGSRKSDDSGASSAFEASLAKALENPSQTMKESKSSLKLDSSVFASGAPARGGAGTSGNGAGGPPGGSGSNQLDAKADAAIGKALDWLAANQNDDGSWGVKEETKQVYTPLAVLAFVCRGEGVESKRYGERILASAKLLASWAKGMGTLKRRVSSSAEEEARRPAEPAQNYASPGGFRSHPLILCALARLYENAQVPELRVALERASLAVAADVERGLGGDWYERWLRYQGTAVGSKIPDSEKPEPACGELSFSGWNCVALRTSLWTGYEFDGVVKALDATERGVKLRFEEKGGGFKLSRGEKPDLSSTGLGVVSLQLLGEGNAKESLRSFDWLKRNVNSMKSCSWKPDRQLLNENPDAFTEAVSGWFYQTQALHTATEGKGPIWKTWREASAKSLTAEQSAEGFWLTPAEKYGDESSVDVRKSPLSECGRTRAFADQQDLKVYATSLCCLILETPGMRQPVFKPGQGKPLRVQSAKPDAKVPLSLD